MKFGNKLTFWGLLILGGSLFVSSSCLAADPLIVTRCIDGDTLQLSNGEKVRLIGVDIPVEIDKKAAEFTRKLVEGQQVRLEYDVQQKDKYGRTLAYVFVFVCSQCKYDAPVEYEVAQLDGNSFIFLNATLAKAGYAQVMTPALNEVRQAVPPNVKYQELFVKLEKEAGEKKMGLWKGEIDEHPKKLGYNLGIEDATGEGNVRVSNAKIGVDYKVSKNSTVGVEARQGIHDTQDAAAWGKSVNDETAARAKYKLSFD